MDIFSLKFDSKRFVATDNYTTRLPTDTTRLREALLISMFKALSNWLRLRRSSPTNPDGPRGWIGVDLDGTLAQYDGWMGHHHIGEPIEPMLQRVNQWLSEGREVRIFTARASVKEHKKFVELWLQQQGLEGLEVTNLKDYGMIELWDDRCIQVTPNSGQPIIQTK